MDNIFSQVKQAVSVPQAAQYYGLTADRSGKCCCLFHRDKHPSMKLNDDYYYCFACHASGDVIKLTAKLFDLSKKEAAQKLIADFGLKPSETLKRVAEKRNAKRMEWNERQHVLALLNENISLLRWWKEEYAPKHPEEEFNEDFAEACRLLEFFQYLSDVLSFGHPDDAERAMKYVELKGLIPMMEKALEVCAWQH